MTFYIRVYIVTLLVAGRFATETVPSHASRHAERIAQARHAGSTVVTSLPTSTRVDVYRV